MSETKTPGKTPPWQPIPADVELEHGPYADYVCWERWLTNKQFFEDVDGEDIRRALEGLDFRAMIALYTLCWDLVEGTAS